ncbi:MAG: RepB family DNA primase, partial [Thermomicrobia bacterium]|nr:RepB family DNA primase [Thermomicrobia bacterium]MCA1723385.1 RepB family DNA primase [Thermomicrobia bacterium]
MSPGRNDERRAGRHPTIDRSSGASCPTHPDARRNPSTASPPIAGPSEDARAARARAGEHAIRDAEGTRRGDRIHAVALGVAGPIESGQRVPRRRAAPPTPRTPSEFVDFLWGGYTGGRHGHFAAAYRPADGAGAFQHRWYRQRQAYHGAAEIASLARHGDTYLAVGQFRRKARTRDAVDELRWVWADLDAHALAPSIPPPTLLMETSPGRTQALWALRGSPPVETVEEYVRRIAAACGLENAAVAANQILRIPGTTNHGARKARPDALVQVVDYRAGAIYRLDEFAHLPPGVAPVRAVGVLLLASREASMEALARVRPRLTARTRALSAGADVPARCGTPYP